VTDYLPAIFEEDMAEYLAEFKSEMPAYAATFNIAGSFEADHVSAWYRSPVELGWKNRINFDHDFIGCRALKEEVAHPRRLIRTLVWNADDVVEVYASLFRGEEPYHYMEIPRDQRGFMYADKVMRNDNLVGITTSRGYSYYFRQMLSLCVIDREHSEPGTDVTLIWGKPGKPQKEIRARVAPAPYKKDNRKADVRSL
jgi:vanillate/3-O-methylgallate O-demethylase